MLERGMPSSFAALAKCNSFAAVMKSLFKRWSTGSVLTARCARSLPRLRGRAARVLAGLLLGWPHNRTSGRTRCGRAAPSARRHRRSKPPRQSLRYVYRIGLGRSEKQIAHCADPPTVKAAARRAR